MLEWVIDNWGVGVIYWLCVLLPYGLLFWEERNILEKRFEDSFIKAWNIIYLLSAFFSWYGGHADDLERTFRSGNVGIGIGEAIGGLIGLFLFSLFFTYLYVLLKKAFIKLHKFTNKK